MGVFLLVYTLKLALREFLNSFILVTCTTIPDLVIDSLSEG